MVPDRVSNFFLTGGTGRLGRPLALHLARDGHDLSLLVRKESRRGAREWLAELRTAEPAVAGRMRMVTGDLSREEIVDARDRSALLESTEVVLHAGAAVGANLDRAWAWAHNVRGTTHLMALAEQMARLRRFVHISTTEVAGEHVGPFSESALLVGQRHRGEYGESKMVAERRVRASDLPWTILRPGQPPRDWLVEVVAVLAEHPASLRTCVHLHDPDTPGTGAVYDTRNAVRLLRPLGLELVEYARERGV